MKSVLVLDFDGVICDGLDECMLATWNSYHDKEVSSFGPQGFTAIPNAFIERFRACRNLSTHLGHFLVPLLDQTTTFSSQDAFDRIYNSINPMLVDDFTEKVAAYRHLARRYKRAYWLACHTLYPGLATFLRTRSRSLPVYIVTAKDQGSVAAILAAHEVPFAESHIFGEQRTKLQALAEICRQEQVDTPAQLHFLDDNVTNVYAAQQAGYHASWASWGYHTPEHIQFAQTHDIPIVTRTNDLLTLYS